MNLGIGSTPREQDVQHDTICGLIMTNKYIFSDFVNSEWMQRPIAELKVQNPAYFNRAVYYFTMSKQSGEYFSLLIDLDSAWRVQSVNQFDSEQKKLILLDSKKTPFAQFSFDSLFSEKNYYTTRYYVSDGGIILLASFEEDTLVNGLLYNGCAPFDMKNEKHVENPRYLELLQTIRALKKK